jgi:hypothetical protein
MYYSNEILSKALPTWAPYVSLVITIVSVLMTFPAIFLVDVSKNFRFPRPMYNSVMQRMGRSLLLQASVAGAVFSLVAVGFGLDNRYPTVVGVSIITFVMSFAVGLGPVPFVLISEVSPVHVSLFKSGSIILWYSHMLSRAYPPYHLWVCR